MPLYEYRCAKCKRRFEKIEKLSARRKQKCPHCGGQAERLISASGFHFKGSGWYVTDYARAGGEPAKKEDAAASDSKEVKEAKETKRRADAEATAEQAEAAAERRRADEAKAKKLAGRHRHEAALRTAHGDVERRQRELDRLRTAVDAAEEALKKAKAIVTDLEAKLEEL